MKKLLSLITAGALALGLIGCSGDLHDNELSPVDMTGYFIAGSMQNPQWKETDDSIAFKKVEGEDYTYEATFTADADKVNFAFLPTKGSWNGQVGGDKMAGDSLPKDVKFEDTDNGNGGRNGTISGLTAKAVYKMTVETSTGVFKISLAEQKTPEYFLLDGYFIRSLDAGWNGTASNLLWNPVKDPVTGDVTYKVEFTATASTQQLALARQVWGDGRYECAAPTSFAVGADPITLEKGKVEHPTVTGLVVDRPYNVVVKTTTDGTVTMSVEQIMYIDVVGFKVINADDYEGKTIYFLEGWVPGNNWDNTNPSAVVTDGVAGKTITSTRLTVDSIPLQMTAPEVGGGFWDVKVGGGTKNVDNEKDFKVYILQYDCDNDELSLVEAIS